MSTKDTQVTIRLDAELVEEADALVDKIGPVTTRVAVLREAIREGLKVLAARYRPLPSPDTKSPAAPRKK